MMIFDFAMFCVGIMALCGTVVCIVGVYDIISQNIRRKKQIRKIEDMQRRLP